MRVGFVIVGIGALCACGRIGFDPTGDGGGSSSGDGGFVGSHVAYLKASNADPGDQFGLSVAVSADGTTIAVGAPTEASGSRQINGNESDNSVSDAGAVYVFVRIQDTWQQQAYLKASNADPGDQFGWAVSLSSDGSTLAVGARQEKGNSTGVGGNEFDNSSTEAGAAYVFVRTGTTWTQQVYLKAINTGVDDEFASTIAISGDGNVLVAGAGAEDSDQPLNSGDNAAPNAGAAYVYTRTGTTWAFTKYLKCEQPDTDDFFQTVAISGDGSTIAVGANSEDGGSQMIDGSQLDNTQADAGAIYIFTAPAWSQQAYIKTPNAEAGDSFGSGLGLSYDGNRLIGGASDESSSARGIDGSLVQNGRSASGAAYVFERTGTTWTYRTFIKTSNADANDTFAADLAISADGLTIVGGATEEDDVARESGAAYVFTRGSTWTERAIVKDPAPTADDNLGWAVAVSGDGSVVVVAVPYEDGGARTVDGPVDEASDDAGAVYVLY